MHSRIIELSKDPILKHERMCESSVPDWFYHSIADYTDADTDRDHDIKWFLDAVARVVDVAEDGKSFTFKPKAKQKYFERQYHAFLDKACELTGISLDAFVGETKYDIGMAMYKLNEHYQDMLRSRSAAMTKLSWRDTPGQPGGKVWEQIQISPVRSASPPALRSRWQPDSSNSWTFGI